MDDLTPEQLEQLIALGAIPDKQALLMKQMDSADQLRNQSVPRGGMAGRVYVGDPFGALAGGVGRVLANKRYNQMAGQYGQNVDAQTVGRKNYAQMIMEALRGPKMQPAGDQGNGVTTYGVP